VKLTEGQEMFKTFRTLKSDTDFRAIMKETHGKIVEGIFGKFAVNIFDLENPLSLINLFSQSSNQQADRDFVRPSASRHSDPLRSFPPFRPSPLKASCYRCRLK